jgi:hypothetical protein
MEAAALVLAEGRRRLTASECSASGVGQLQRPSARHCCEWRCAVRCALLAVRGRRYPVLPGCTSGSEPAVTDRQGIGFGWLQNAWLQLDGIRLVGADTK